MNVFVQTRGTQSNAHGQQSIHLVALFSNLAVIMTVIIESGYMNQVLWRIPDQIGTIESGIVWSFE